jgi:membrane-associated phospholipid phosphatase
VVSDAFLALAGMSVFVGTEVDKTRLAPAGCHWCGLPTIDDRVRSALVWSPSRLRTADGLGNLMGFGVVPLAAIGVTTVAAARDAEAGGEHWGVDMLVVVESAALAIAVDQTVKFAVARERPYVHFHTDTGNPADYNLSFFSGHTTLAFSIATASGMVATLRGYRWAPWVWATGMVLATAVGYLRIAADRHYFTDVLVGSAMGSAFGVVVPYLHRTSLPVLVAAAPSREGGIVSLAGRW